MSKKEQVEKLAILLGTSRSTIERWLREGAPSIAKATRLRDALRQLKRKGLPDAEYWGFKPAPKLSKLKQMGLRDLNQVLDESTAQISWTQKEHAGSRDRLYKQALLRQRDRWLRAREQAMKLREERETRRPHTAKRPSARKPRRIVFTRADITKIARWFETDEKIIRQFLSDASEEDRYVMKEKLRRGIKPRLPGITAKRLIEPAPAPKTLSEARGLPLNGSPTLGKPIMFLFQKKGGK